MLRHKVSNCLFLEATPNFPLLSLSFFPPFPQSPFPSSPLSDLHAQPPTSLEALPALTSPSIALAEIHLALACLFRPDGPHLQLFETDETDVIVAHDFFFPAVKKDSKGVRTRVL